MYYKIWVFGSNETVPRVLYSVVSIHHTTEKVVLVKILKIDISSLIVQDCVFGLQQIGARQAVNQGGGEDGPSSARTLPPAHHLEPSWPPSSSDKVQPVTPSCATDT